MDLLSLWQEKLATGKIRFDDNLLVIQPNLTKQDYIWGTVFYSKSREDYKTKVKKTQQKTTFDLELMRHLQIAEFGGLIVAANPNSLFRGHLVIFPKKKAENLHFQDVFDITQFAEIQKNQTFILNMEHSAASILDWAHFQAYPIIFPIEKEKNVLIETFSNVRISRMNENFPVFALIVETSESEILTTWLLKILQLLAEKSNPHGQKIPLNIIWRNNRAWIIPRALNQSTLAARYFGGLEMGGIFCLPNADDFRHYLPENLRNEIYKSTLSNEQETQKWFEENAIRILCETV